jgi:hypothetical protein
VAIFGGSLAFRTVARLVLKALMLVSKQTILTLEADEAEARAWLTKQRNAHLAQKRG